MGLLINSRQSGFCALSCFASYVGFPKSWFSILLKWRKILHPNSSYTLPRSQGWAASCCQHHIVSLVKLHICSCCCPLAFRGFIVWDCGTKLKWRKELEGSIYPNCAHTIACGPYLGESHFPVLRICYFTWGSSFPQADIVFEAPCTVLRQMGIYTMHTCLKSLRGGCFLLEQQKNAFNVNEFLISTGVQDTERLFVL